MEVFEMSATNPTDDQLSHERLCAYLFGELEGAERARFEAELAASPELCAERERLEATIDLVRAALPAEEALSPSARAALAEASVRPGEPAHVRPFPLRLLRSPVTAAAAGLAVLAGIALLAQRGGAPAVERERELDGELLARTETAAAPAEENAPVQETEAADLKKSLALAEGDRRDADQAKILDQVANAVRPTPAVPERQLEARSEVGELLVTYEDEAAPGEVPAAERPAGNEGSEADKSGAYRGPSDSATPAELEGMGYLGGGVDVDASSAPAAETSPTVGAVEHFGTGTPSTFVSSRAGGKGKDLGLKAAPPPARATGGSRLAPPGTPGATASAGELLAGLGGDLGKRRAVDGPSSPGPEGFLRELGYVDGDDDEHHHVDLPARCDELVRFCRIRPQETPSMMFFRCWGDNPFEFAALDRLSTFAADVDTASYALARNYLARGLMPTKEQIRTEEFINSFATDVPAPLEDTFALALDLAPSRFAKSGEWMLRVVLKGKEVAAAERPRLALTFVVDGSGSMQQENRLELVKHALRLLAGQLDGNDAVAIVAFSNEARLVLPMTTAVNRGLIESAIFGLQSDGGTNAEAGLKMGYEVAAAGLTPGANNRVILLSDGVANIGHTSVEAMLANVAEQRALGIYLNAIGVGMGNHNDALLEQLADKGDGICNYIDDQEEARRVLVENFTGALVPIARDVKIQVEFDPTQVQSYRLLGYENRAVADAAFRDDKVDAGEIGAGHQVTALYELVRAPSATSDGPLATARVRFKPPFAVDSAERGAEARAAAETAREIERSVAFRDTATEFRGATAGFQKAALVAQFAEFLRRSVHARADDYDDFLAEVLRVAQLGEDASFRAFARLAADHSDLVKRNLPRDDAITQALDELTRHNYLKGQLERLKQENRELTQELLEKLQRENAELEQRIKDLIQQELERPVQDR
jgi:Ca-activated chloride channel family protein